MKSENAIEIRGLTKSYKKTAVLKGLDLVVKRGTMLALLGPNGAGKTTTVRILSTLLQPDGGEVLVNGLNVAQEGDAVRKVIGLTGQYAAVDELLTGRENLIMMCRLYHLPKAEQMRRTKELLTKFDLTEAADRPTKTYSGGMRRRLDLALSLVAAPPIIFLDEPTTGLDPRSRITMWKSIQELMKEGATILLTTQYLEEADKLADQIAVLDHGKIIAIGTADELKSRVGNERIEMVINETSSFDKAVAVMSGIPSQKNAALQKNKDERTISISTDGSVLAIKNVLDALYGAGIDLDTLSVHKPTLDDVFLQLTGHSAEEDKKNSHE